MAGKKSLPESPKSIISTRSTKPLIRITHMKRAINKVIMSGHLLTEEGEQLSDNRVQALRNLHLQDFQLFSSSVHQPALYGYCQFIRDISADRLH